MNWILYLLVVVGLSNSCFGQTDTMTIKPKVQNLPQVFADKAYYNRYMRELARVRKIYPYALKAKQLIDELDGKIAAEEKKRKQKKLTKQAHEVLKDEYTFLIRDLYQSEGQLLMKLIHRETGLTVEEIIQKYRGKVKAEWLEQLGKIWNQDLNIQYDPNGKDKLTEKIIQDIKDDTVPFENHAPTITKEEYKENMKEYRLNKKKYKKELRKQKKRAGS